MKEIKGEIVEPTITWSKKNLWSLKLLDEGFEDNDNIFYQLTNQEVLYSIVLEDSIKKELAFLLKDYYFKDMKETDSWTIDPMTIDRKELYQLFSIYNYSAMLLAKSWLEELKEFSQTW